MGLVVKIGLGLAVIIWVGLVEKKGSVITGLGLIIIGFFLVIELCEADSLIGVKVVIILGTEALVIEICCSWSCYCSC